MNIFPESVPIDIIQKLTDGELQDMFRRKGESLNKCNLTYVTTQK